MATPARPELTAGRGGLLSADNRLLVLARQGQLRLPAATPPRLRRFLNRHYPLLAAPMLLLVWVGFSLILALTAGQAVTDGASGNAALALGLCLGFLPMLLLAWFWVRGLEQRPFSSLGLEWTRPGAAWRFGRGVLMGVGLITTVSLLLAAPGFLQWEAGRLVWPDAASLLGALFVFAGWLVQGTAEEVLVRGALFPILAVRYGVAPAMVVSAAVFALLHLSNPNLTLLALLNLFLYGIFAVLYALYEGGLWGICGLHSAWNWALLHLFGLPVSGSGGMGATVLDLQETGPDWLTGGPFGPEGGVVVTVLLLGGSAAVWLARRRRNGEDGAGSFPPPATSEENV